MPSSFTRADVEKIAALAHLELDDAEIDLFGRQLSDILAYAERVQRIDTSGIPPTTGIVSNAVAHRDDHVAASLDRDAALANAPDPSPVAGLFKVPRVIG